MECDPGTFERIVETKCFHVKPAVLGRRDLLRFAFGEEVSQYGDGSTDSDKTVSRQTKQRLYFYSPGDRCRSGAVKVVVQFRVIAHWQSSSSPSTVFH